MMIENVTIIGVGLIGGSFALALKEQQLAKNIIGVDASEKNIEKALTLGLIDEALSLEEAVKKSGLIFLTKMRITEPPSSGSSGVSACHWR